ncbi:MAG: hypothetical protein ACK55I_05510, partial [bacterium]
AGLALLGALPDAEVVPHVGRVRGAAQETARDEAVLLVHAGIELEVEVDPGLVAKVTRHVAAHVVGTIREPVREAGVRAGEQQRRRPAIPRRQHEARRAVLD